MINVEPDDKAERILSLYSQLQDGRVISKAKASAEYGVAPRTIQRDIADIQRFLQSQGDNSGELREVVYDKNVGGYRMQTKTDGYLKPQELLAMCKVLLESRALVKEELFPILDKLSKLCINDEDQKQVRKYISNEMHHYIELHHGKKLLNTIWILDQAVYEHRYIHVRYKKANNQELVERKLKPVGIMFSEFYFYLAAFIEDIVKETAFENPSDPFPTIYRIDRLESLDVLDDHFFIPYKNRFEEGEFRKRVQFMYGGRLQRVKFQYSGPDIDSILDRLPTAEILSEKDGIYTVTAETFGKGIDMWMKSQGEYIQRLN